MSTFGTCPAEAVRHIEHIGGDWHHAIPIASCGLRLDVESIRVAVGLWLRTKCLRSTRLRLWHWSRSLYLQTWCWSNRQTSGPERRRCKGVCVLWRPSHQGACMVDTTRWQSTRRSDDDSIIPWQRVTAVHTLLADSSVSAAARSGVQQ